MRPPFPRHGYSQTLPFDDEIIPALVDHTIDVADTLGFDRFHLEGQSLDGSVGVLLALGHPDRLRPWFRPPRWVIGPTLRNFPASNFKIRSRCGTAIEVLQNPTFEAVRDRLSSIVPDPTRVSDEAVRIRQTIYNISDVNAIQQKLMRSYLGGRAPRKHEFGDFDLKEMRTPTPLFWADHNPLTTVVGQRILDLILQFYCSPTTGHWAQYEDFEEHNRRVIAFLSAASSEKDGA